MSWLKHQKMLREPFYRHPKRLVTFWVLRFTLWGVNGLILVIFSEGLINSITVQDASRFQQLLWIAFAFFMGYQIYNFFSSKFFYLNYSLKRYINRTILAKFFQLDPQAVQQMGTGRVISIVQKGMQQREDIIHGMMMSIPPLIVSLVWFTYLAAGYGWIYVIGVISILAGMAVISIYLHGRNGYRRKQKYKIAQTLDRNMVKLIMHQFDIASLHMQDQEIHRMKQLINKQESVYKKQHLYAHLSYMATEALLVLLKLGLLGIG